MSNTKATILLCLFLILIQVFVIAKPVEAATLTVSRLIYSSLEDGYIDFADTDYSTAWNSTSGWVEDTDEAILGGQRLFAGDYSIFRTFLFFDTDVIPDDATITEAKIGFYCTGNATAVTDYNITVQNGQPTYPHKPLQTGDYYEQYYSGNGGQLSTTTIYLPQNYNLTLNSNGISWINLEGFTKFCLRSDREIDGIVPTGNEYLGIKSRDYGDIFGEFYSPKLYVTYETTGYSYVLYGAYDEQGIRQGAINVTFYKIGEAPEAFTLDGNYTVQSENIAGTVFEFDLGYNESRIYYIRQSTENIYVFKPSQPYYTYYFTVVDYVGITNGYLETLINVNGTDRVVERWKLDILNDIPFTLSWGVAYKIRLICDQGTYVYGSYVAGATSSFTLTITHDMFPPSATHIGNITVSATRPQANVIQVNYTDTANKTNWVYVAIYKLTESTVLYSTNNTGNTHQINWNNADNQTDYRAKVIADHQVRGTLAWGFSLPAPEAYTNPWDLSVLGSFPFESSQVIGLGIVLLAFGSFSAQNAPLGMVVGVIIAAILTFIGFLDISWAWLSVTMAIALISALSISRKRSEGKAI